MKKLQHSIRLAAVAILVAGFLVSCEKDDFEPLGVPTTGNPSSLRSGEVQNDPTDVPINNEFIDVTDLGENVEHWDEDDERTKGISILRLEGNDDNIKDGDNNEDEDDGQDGGVE